MPKSVKKVIILDAGGVMQPDAELGASNQVMLSQLTNMTPDEQTKCFSRCSLGLTHCVIQ